MHHLIALDWVESVDSQVHLNRTCGEAIRDWEEAPLGAGL
jgi:hypothetical protein